MKPTTASHLSLCSLTSNPFSINPLHDAPIREQIDHRMLSGMHEAGDLLACMKPGSDRPGSCHLTTAGLAPDNLQPCMSNGFYCCLTCYMLYGHSFQSVGSQAPLPAGRLPRADRRCRRSGQPYKADKQSAENRSRF